MKIEITEQEVKDLKAIRNYFGEHDKTLFEHKSYAVVDRLVKKLNIPDVSGLVCDSFKVRNNYKENQTCERCGKFPWEHEQTCH